MNSKAQIVRADRTVHKRLSKIAAALWIISTARQSTIRFKLLNAQFLQQQESATDYYSFDRMEKLGIDTSCLVTSFKKLAKMAPDHQSNLFDEHLSSDARAQNICGSIAAVEQSKVRIKRMLRISRSAIYQPQRSFFLRPGRVKYVRAARLMPDISPFFGPLLPVDFFTAGLAFFTDLHFLGRILNQFEQLP